MAQKYKTGNSLLKHFDFIIVDLFLLEISYFIAVFWYHYSFGKSLDFGSEYRQQCLILFVCLTASLTIGQPYNNILKRDKWQESNAVVKHSFNMGIMDITLMYLMKDTTSTSRLTFVATWVVYIFLELMFRLVWKRILRSYITKHTTSRRQVAVLTEKKRAYNISENLDVYLFRDFDVNAAFLVDFDKQTDTNVIFHNAKVLGDSEDLINYVTHNWVDEVILDLPENRALCKKIESLLTEMGIITHYTVSIIDDVENETMNSVYVEKMGNYIVLTYKPREIAPIQIYLKRLLDIVGGVIGSLLAVIIIIIIGPIIKIKSPGPVIFSQTRVGKNGKIFKMYKIRSMYLDAEKRKKALMSQNKMDGFMFKIDNDPRIIGSEKKDKNGKSKGIGNFIRNTSLDEFPQFFNVIKGDMSLVGTRPPTLDEWNRYSPQHRKRLAIKPGITGMWQISGRSQITSFDEVVRLDSEYIDSWTVGMDLKIILKTIGKVVRKDGAQ